MMLLLPRPLITASVAVGGLWSICCTKRVLSPVTEKVRQCCKAMHINIYSPLRICLCMLVTVQTPLYARQFDETVFVVEKCMFDI